MSPVTHFLASWVVASIPRNTTRRDRALIVVGGLCMDLDGLGAVPDTITRNTTFFTEQPTAYFHEYHHLLHCVGFFSLATAIVFGLAWKWKKDGTSNLSPWVVAAFFFVTFHLHLLCDVAGSQGPDGSQWEIPYLLPFSDAWQWRVSWQWQLDDWKNLAITGALILGSGVLAVRRSYSFLSFFNLRLDKVVVDTLQNRFGGKQPEASEAPEAETQET